MVLEKSVVEAFPQFLNRQRLELVRGKTTVLQVNVGLVCNLRCRHCYFSKQHYQAELSIEEWLT